MKVPPAWILRPEVRFLFVFSGALTVNSCVPSISNVAILQIYLNAPVAVRLHQSLNDCTSRIDLNSPAIPLVHGDFVAKNMLN